MFLFSRYIRKSPFQDKKERPHWRTRLFASEVLAQLVELCHEEDDERHFNLARARAHSQPDQVFFCDFFQFEFLYILKIKFQNST